MRVTFPMNFDQRLYEVHYAYMLNLLRAANVDVTLDVMREPVPGCFPIKIDDKEFIVDYSDSGDVVHGNHMGCPPHFRFHCKSTYPITPPCKEPCADVFPFPPTSFHDWTQYAIAERDLKYTCGFDSILFKQRPYGDATIRRNHVRDLLVNEFDELVDTKWDDGQEYFWKRASECLVSVHVPGRNNNMLDRAQFQLMGLGVCTISPKLPEILPGTQSFRWLPAACGGSVAPFVPGSTYIQCADDYSDLISTILWCRKNRDACRLIGENAKQLFQETSTPGAVVKYMEGVAKCAYPS